MGKKLKKDFAKRRKIKEEAKLLGKESADMDETHKLKHGDDYRGKIIHDKDRFQDKIHEKESKRNSEKETLQGSSKRKTKQPKNAINDKKIDTPTEKSQDSFVSDHQSGAVTSFENDAKAAEVIVSAPESIRKEKEISFEEQKTELLKKRKMAEKVRKDLNLKETSQQNEELYDPLGKDLDNDGIIDRYDNDFRDSDYFESAYDVEDNLHTKEDRTENSSQNHKAQKKLYKRKNYSDKVYTRKKEDNPADDKTEGKKSAKEVIQDREKKNRISKEQETSKKKNAVKVSALSRLAKGSEAVRDYLSHGSDENQGVEAGEKVADTSSKLIHGIKNYSDKRKNKKGYYFGSKAPYGYVKDENDHHQLIVDEAVRPIIKEVFARYLSGESMLAIAKDLNERKVLTPGKHIGLQRGTGIWTGQIVRYLLTQRVYTGAIVGGKTRVYEVGSDHRQWMDSEDWIIRENMHEAIISQEDFAEVQNRLSSNAKHISRERKHFHILQDKVYCGKCHHKMSYTVYSGKSDGYYCSYRYKAKDCGCMKGKIQALVLEEIVSKEIQLYTEHFLEEEQTRRIEYRVKESICESLLERKKKLEAEQQKNQISKMQCYERHKQGIIKKDEYFAKRESLTQRTRDIEQEISVIEDKIQENTALRHHLNVDKLREAVAKGELVLDWINEVIDKIYVYDKDKVEIVWKFEC